METATTVRLGSALTAIVQLAIFGYLGFTDHAYSVANARRRAMSFENFSCLELKRWYPPVEEGFFNVDCYATYTHRYVIGSNLPVFLVTVPLALTLGPKLRLSQVVLFYSLNGICIPLFWYVIGSGVARTLAKRRSAKATPVHPNC